METLLQFIATLFPDPGAQRLLVICSVGLAIGVLAIGVGYLIFGASNPVRRRLHEVGSGPGADAPLDSNQQGGFTLVVQTLLGPVSHYVLPQDAAERDGIEQKLAHAGFRRNDAFQLFYAIKIVLVVGLPLLVLLAGRFLPELTGQKLFLYALVAGGAGLLVPNIVLEKLRTRRLKRLRDGFPDALDLLVVCIEAGLGLAQSIQRVADELFVSHPELAQELSLVNAEVRVGVDRVQALKNLSTRTGLEDIRGLVSLLVQTIRFGTSIAESLRVYAEEFRDKRMQLAEEQAAKIGTKMIFPLVMFMFPAFFVVAVGPAVILLGNAFSSVGAS